MRNLWICSLVFSSVIVNFALNGAETSKSAQPLSAVLAAVMTAGYESITEISFDDGRWEVEALKDGKSIGLRIDPASTKVRSEYPDEPHPVLPASAKPLDELLAELEKAGYSSIRKVDFESTGWEVEARREQGWRELKLDLRGKIVADKVDD